MTRKKKKRKSPRRWTAPKIKNARTEIMYQRTTSKRTGKPVIHLTLNRMRQYIMVRAKGGGVKRLYLDTKTAKKRIIKGYSALVREAKRFAKTGKR